MCCKSNFDIQVESASIDSAKFEKLKTYFGWTPLQSKIISKMRNTSEKIPVFSGNADEVVNVTTELALVGVNFKLIDSNLK